MKNIVVATLMAIALVACYETEPRSVEWFLESEVDREAVLEECVKHAVPSSIECLNAQKAKDSLDLKRRGYVRPEPVDFSKEE